MLGNHHSLVLLARYAVASAVAATNGRVTLYVSSSSFWLQAKPKVADYPFTTLHPTVGVINFRDAHTMTVADIPGLIEGAHANRGLGHEFLRHIERTKILAYVIDASGRYSDPVADLHVLQNELRMHNEQLLAKPSVVVANKMDLETSVAGIAKLRTATQLPVLGVSALQKTNLDNVVSCLRWLLEAHQRQQR